PGPEAHVHLPVRQGREEDGDVRELDDLRLVAGRLQRLCPYLRGGGDLGPALGDADTHRGAADGAAVGAGVVVGAVCCAVILCRGCFLELRDLPFQLGAAVSLFLRLSTGDATPENIEATGEAGHTSQNQGDDGR